MRRVARVALLAAILTCLGATPQVSAGSLDAPGAPAAGSGMPSTADIYNRLDTGAAIVIPGAFSEPVAGPAASGRSLAEIGAKLPAPDNANGATAAQVTVGKTFWGLRTDGTWGTKTGTQAVPANGANVTGGNGLLSFSIPDGLYAGGKTATAVDGNLLAGNIKSGVTIFGITGTASQGSGTAAAADVLAGKTFSNSGASGINGTMADNGAVNITPGTAAQPIPAGYHNGSGSVAGDANLVAGNIKSGATIFGVSGTASQASGTAVAADVLSGKTFSNVSASGVSGSMTNNGAVTITPGTAAQTIPAGYHNGSGSVAGDANLVSGNIRSGVTLFGVSGNSNVVDTTEATAPASAADIGIGKKAYVNGSLVTGTSALATSHVARALCASGWGGANCDVCAGQWSGASCNVCPSGWSGANCDIIAKPFPAAVPSYVSTPWKCVLDTATGLTWEVKTTDGAQRDLNNTYTWYDSGADVVNHGTATAGTCIGTAGCDTEKFVAAVNAEQLCGYTNWRMPSLSELQGLVVTGSNPTIDTAYFPNTPSGAAYWTGSSDVSASNSAWIVQFRNGASFTNLKSDGMFVRLVRGP